MLAQLAFFRVHGTHQHEAAIRNSRNAFPLHPVLLGTVGGQHDIRQVILQQIHFVHIEDLSIGFRQNTGLVHSLTGFHGLLQIYRADKPVFRHRQG